MGERAYTVKEIDDLRAVCEKRYLFGSCAPPPPTMKDRQSCSYRESDKHAAVEQQVRTHMLAGHVAQDLIDADIERQQTEGRRAKS